MKLRRRFTAEATVPTGSMADIAFLLIIFFLYTFNLEVDRTQVTLPSAMMRVEIPEDAAYIAINREGLLRVSDGEEMSRLMAFADLRAFVVDLHTRFPERPVVIKADHEVDYEKVDQVMDAIKQTGGLVYLLTQHVTIDS